MAGLNQTDTGGGGFRYSACLTERDIIQALRYIVEQIYTVVAATTDGNGEPGTCAIDIMDYDTDGLYFLTAKGKNIYNRRKKRGSEKEGIT